MYNSKDNIDKLVAVLKGNAFPYDGIVLSPDLVTDQHSFTLKDGLSMAILKTTYPDIKWIFPYSPIVDGSQQKDLTTKWPGILVSVSGNLVEITNGDKKGYCFDYFHPNTQHVLDTII